MGLGGSQTVRLTAVSAANVAGGAALQFLGILSLGAGVATDAYFAALTVPAILAAILIPAVANNLTPQLSGLDAVRRAALTRLVLLKSAGPVLLAFATLGLSATWWLPLLFPGLDGAASDLAIELSPALCAVFLVNVVLAIGSAAHHAASRLAFTELVQAIVSAVALLLVLPVTDRYGIVGLAWLLLARAVANFLVLCGPFLVARRADVHADANIFWTRTGELVGASLIFKLGPVVDRVLASFLAPGVMTAVGLGQQVAGSAGTLTDRVFSRPLLVTAGRGLASGEQQAIRAAYRAQVREVGYAALLVAGAGVLAVGFAAWYWPAAYAAALEAMGRADLVAAFAMVAIPAAFGQLSAALLYARGDVRRLSRLATASFLVATLFKVVGFLLMGVYAIVLGAFLYQVLNWAMFHREATRPLGPQAT